jgi:hypothetical protein
MLVTGFLFKNTAFRTTITISKNTYNFKLISKLKELGWNERGIVYATVIIDSDIVVGSMSTKDPAFEIEKDFESGSEIQIINNGTIVGAGGETKSMGGTAIKTAASVTITNNGFIYSGGGGVATAQETISLSAVDPESGGEVTYTYAIYSGDGGSGAGSYPSNILKAKPNYGVLYTSEEEIPNITGLIAMTGGTGGELGCDGFQVIGSTIEWPEGLTAKNYGTAGLAGYSIEGMAFVTINGSGTETGPTKAF